MGKTPIYLFSTSSHPKAISVNSLDITFLQPTIDFSQYDYFLLTSKQAVNALQEYDEKVLHPALCISEQTAKFYEAIGGKVLHLGAGYGDTFTKTIKNYPKDTKWLYLRAKEIASDFAQRCKEDGYDIDEKIVYQSECSEDIARVEVDDTATLIFTSPSSVKCFLKSHKLKNTHKVIVIGHTTADSLPQDKAYIIAKVPTIEGCLALCD